jgi:hypothetical protein
MNFIVDKAKALKKWTPVLEHLNVSDMDKRTWMAEYAEMHQLNENVAYGTLGNMYGMGPVSAPQGTTIGGPANTGQVMNYTGNGSPVNYGTQGSGDVAQNLLPVSMKIAAQTIGLDLVAVKPASSPRIEMLFIDFKYDNNPEGHVNEAADERPLVFKVSSVATGISGATLSERIQFSLREAQVNELVGGLDRRVFIHLSGGTGAAHFADGDTVVYNALLVNTAPTNRQGWLEFLGFSKVDGLPMFRTFRQDNTGASAGAAGSFSAFNAARNTFPNNTSSVQTMLQDAIWQNLDDDTTTGASWTDFGPDSRITISLVSTMEDHLPGFSAGWNLNSSMSRLQDEQTYPGIIGPDVFTKSVSVGDIEISSALKRTQIEDIKASTGMDIVQKLESVLINELTQTISKQIVDKIRTLAAENKASHTTPKDSLGFSKFDFNVDAYMLPLGPAPGGETYHSVQRKLIAKINNASNFIATDGRVGPAQYLVTNGNLASVLQDVAGYTIAPTGAGKLNTNGQLYPMGNIGNIAIYVDPYMRWDDNRIFLGRKNSVDQPGLVFIPYLMAQSISLISEATWAPRMLIRSRYAITDIGFFPWKQYMEIKVTDTNGVLI